MAPPPSRFGRWRAASLASVYALMGLHLAHCALRGRSLAPLEFSESLYTLHLGIVTAGAIFLVAAMAGTLVFGRFFCSWGCHILALEDLSVWLLGKAGIRPAPPRSRALVWMPFGLAFYLFAWPELARWWDGRPWPGLHVQSQGWSSFVTTDVLRQMPGPWLSLATFLVCGFVIVQVLGSRSFCSYVCPYGVLFRGMDRLAPGRIVLSGACTDCGLCTSNCLSGVRVKEEALRYGSVVDPECVRCLDCVGRCPPKALGFGFVKPPILQGLPSPLRRTVASPFSAREECALALLAAAAFLAWRSALGLLPVLLTGAVAALLASGWVLAARLLERRGELRAAGFLLRGPRGLAPAGAALLLFAVLSGLASVDSAAVRYETYRGHALLERSSLDVSALPEAYAHLARAHAWALRHPPGAGRELALLALRLRRPEEADVYLRERLAQDPDDLDALVLSGLVAAQLGRTGEAGARLDRAVELERRAPPARETARSLMGLGTLAARTGRLEQAEGFLARAQRLDPGGAVIAHDLAVVRARETAERNRR